MTVLPERDIDFHILSLVVADDLEALDLDDLSTDTFLIFYLEFSDRLIFASSLSLHTLEFFGFFDHLLRYESEFSSLVGEYIGLVLVGLDLLIQS
jgi:hypothetical protein